MTIKRSSKIICSGETQTGSIVISYTIPTAIQQSYHENPGQSHGSAERTAYIPDTFEGQQLLKRLKFAFQHGLTFAVGTSLTSGKSDSVVWAGILHKTKVTDGGEFGYPDSSYYPHCNAVLDALGVPASSAL